MNPSVVLLIVLTAIFLLVAGAFAWQEQRSRAEDVSVYSVEDSIEYVVGRLSPDTVLKRSDVRRILEWEVRYLQECRAMLGGPVPQRRVMVEALPLPEADLFAEFADGSEREVSTTMVVDPPPSRFNP